MSGQVFDGYGGQAQVDFGKLLLEAQQVDPGPPVETEGAVLDPAGKAQALQVVVAGDTLDIGQPAGLLLALPVFKTFPRAQQPPELL